MSDLGSRWLRRALLLCAIALVGHGLWLIAGGVLAIHYGLDFGNAWNNLLHGAIVVYPRDVALLGISIQVWSWIAAFAFGSLLVALGVHMLWRSRQYEAEVVKSWTWMKSLLRKDRRA